MAAVEFKGSESGGGGSGGPVRGFKDQVDGTGNWVVIIAPCSTVGVTAERE